jgi:hypothetical protein
MVGSLGMNTICDSNAIQGPISSNRSLVGVFCFAAFCQALQKRLHFGDCLPKCHLLPLQGWHHWYMCCKDGFLKCHFLPCQGWHYWYICRDAGWLDGPKIHCLALSTKVVGGRVVGFAPWQVVGGC